MTSLFHTKLPPLQFHSRISRLSMDNPRHSSSALRRTLAQALKRLFKSVAVKNVNGSHDAPVEIIRKDDSRTSYLPRISEVSLFPDFEKGDIDCGAVSDHPSSRVITVPATNASHDSQKALLPAKSLSHFNLHQVYSEQSQLPLFPPARGDNLRTREMAGEIATGRVTSSKPLLVSQRSTLQIRRPDSLHASVSDASLGALFTSEGSSSVIRRSKRSSDLRKCASEQTFASGTPSLTSIAEHSRPVAPATSQEDSSHLVRQFASFCIIDIQAPGCPVSAVSEDLRYLYDIKDRFVLNAQEFSQLSMDLSVGRDPDGNEVTYVLLFSPLVSPATGKSRFMLVSAIDVSGYVRYAASLDSSPEREEEGRSFTSSSQRSKRRRKSSSISWIDERTEQLADELLHGCSIKDTPCGDIMGSYGVSRQANPGHATLDSEDIWTAIAKEEGLIRHEAPRRSRSTASRHDAFSPSSFRNRQKATAPAKSPPSLDYADEKVLGKFVESLQVLYSQYFLLACSPLKDEYYEICYVSPAVSASGDYVTGHLSHMPLGRIHEFGAHLAAGKRFRTSIRWGDQGIEKQVYCVPLIGQQPSPWICMLVDQETPIHW